MNILKTDKKATIPSYKTEHSAGMDLYNLEAFTIKPLERKLVDTGIRVEIPVGYQGEIRPRSGMALDFGITVLNTPGTIDSDYRGNIKVLLINLGNKEVTFDARTRIAQMVINTYAKVSIDEVTVISDTVRGEGGFGSTGLK